MDKQKILPPKETIKNRDELEFTIFCIESIAIRLGVSAQRVYIPASLHCPDGRQ